MRQVGERQKSAEIQNMPEVNRKVGNHGCIVEDIACTSTTFRFEECYTQCFMYHGRKKRAWSSNNTLGG